jgi:hypothetical protein
MAVRAYSGLPFTTFGTATPAAERWKPNFVASTTSSRRPASARPTSSSFAPSPYTSAVSRKVQPASIAACTVAIDSASSPWTPYDWDMPMQPSPRAETVSSPRWDSRIPRTYLRRTEHGRGGTTSHGSAITLGDQPATQAIRADNN